MVVRSEAGTTLLWTAIASAERLSVASSGRPFGKVSKHLRSLDTFWVLLRSFLCFNDPA